MRHRDGNHLSAVQGLKDGCGKLTGIPLSAGLISVESSTCALLSLLHAKKNVHLGFSNHPFKVAFQSDRHLKNWPELNED